MKDLFNFIHIFIFCFSLLGCVDVKKLIFGNHEKTTISVTLDKPEGHYDAIPTSINMTFPATVDMNSISMGDFAIQDTCASVIAQILGVSVSGQVATISLGGVSGCSNTETVTLSINMAAVLMIDTSKNLSGITAYVYAVDLTAPAVSIAVNTISGITASAGYGFSSVPTNIIYSFSSDTDMSTLTAADFAVSSSGLNPCTIDPIIGTVSVDSSAKTVTVPLTGSNCIDGQSFIISIANGSFADSTRNSTTGASSPYLWAGPAIDLTITVLTSGASVSSVGAFATTLDGTYGVGTTVSVVVKFSQSVDVTGSPQLQLNITGGSTRYAVYSTGSGADELQFDYVIATNDTATDLDYANSNSLILNGGTISRTGSSGGIVATRTLPSPGATNSLGYNRNIIVDGTLPTITTSLPTGPSDTWGLNSRTVTFTFSEAIDPATFDSSDISISAGTCSGSLPNVTSATLTGASNNIASFDLSANTCNNSETYTLTFDPSTVTDLANNAGGGSSRSVTVTTSTTLPTISVSAPSSDFVNSLGSITYTVNYSGANSISLANTDVNFSGAATNCAASVSGTGNSTRKIIIANCTDNGAVQIDLAANTAMNSYGNSAAAVPESSILDFTADNLELPDPSLSLPVLGVDPIYNVDIDLNFTLSFSGDQLGATPALQASLSLICDSGGGFSAVAMTVFRTSSENATVAPNEASPDFVYNSSCLVSGSAVPDAAGNTHSFSGLPFKVSRTLAANSGPTGSYSITSLTAQGDLGSVIFNVSTDTSTVNSSNVTLVCNGMPVSISSLTPSVQDTNILVDFDETDSNWLSFSGGESCVLSFDTNVKNSLGEPLPAPVNFNFSLAP